MFAFAGALGAVDVSGVVVVGSCCFAFTAAGALSHLAKVQLEVQVVVLELLDWQA